MDKPQKTFRSRDDALVPVTEASPRLHGTIARMLPAKGFGFIQVDGKLGEYFMHKSAFEDPAVFDALGPGDAVRFSGEMTAKGLRAFNVEVG